MSGGGSSDGVGAIENSLEAFSAAFTTVSASLTVTFERGTEVGVITKYEHVLLCDPEGSSSVKESVSDNSVDGTFLVEADLNECSGVGGELSALGGFTRDPDGLLLNWAFHGILASGDCDVTLDDLTVLSSVQGVPALSLVSGRLTAACLGTTTPTNVLCTWSQTPVLSTVDLLEGCACSGPGC